MMSDQETSVKYDFFKNGSDIRVTWKDSDGPHCHDIPRKFFDIIRDEYMADAFNKWLQNKPIPNHEPLYLEIGRNNFSFTFRFKNIPKRFFVHFRINSSKKIIIFTQIIETEEKVNNWTVSLECYNQMLTIPDLDKLIDLPDMTLTQE